MDAQKVDMYLIVNSKYFENHQLNILRERLTAMDESDWKYLQSIELKDPIISLVLSLLCGGFGVDRFFIGDIGLGVAKLFTCGGCGVWSLIDWFLIMGATKEKNIQKINQVLSR